jgi:hypothetical protein
VSYFACDVNEIACIYFDLLRKFEFLFEKADQDGCFVEKNEGHKSVPLKNMDIP